jgi:hypothetical protein
MNKVFTILLIALLTLSCHRRTVPTGTSEVKDSTLEKTTVLRKDSTISFSPMQSSLATTIDSLVAVINGLMSIPQKPIVYSAEQEAKIQDNSDTIGKTKILEKRTGNMRSSLWVDRSGNLLFNCNTDSLKQKISWLETQLTYEKFHKEIKTIEKPVEVPTPHIPKWMYWLFAISICINIWNYRFDIIALVKHIVKPW